LIFLRKRKKNFFIYFYSSDILLDFPAINFVLKPTLSFSLVYGLVCFLKGLLGIDFFFLKGVLLSLSETPPKEVCDSCILEPCMFIKEGLFTLSVEDLSNFTAECFLLNTTFSPSGSNWASLVFIAPNSNVSSMSVSFCFYSFLSVSIFASDVWISVCISISCVFTSKLILNSASILNISSWYLISACL